MNPSSCLFVLRLWCRSWQLDRQNQFMLITIVIILLWLLDTHITKQLEPFSTLSDIKFVHSRLEHWMFGLALKNVDVTDGD